MPVKTILRCPSCDQRLRVPIRADTIVVHCPCGLKFDVRDGAVVPSRVYEGEWRVSSGGGPGHWQGAEAKKSGLTAALRLGLGGVLPVFRRLVRIVQQAVERKKSGFMAALRPGLGRALPVVGCLAGVVLLVLSWIRIESVWIRSEDNSARATATAQRRAYDQKYDRVIRAARREDDEGVIETARQMLDQPSPVLDDPRVPQVKELLDRATLGRVISLLEAGKIEGAAQVLRIWRDDVETDGPATLPSGSNPQ